MSVPKGQDQRQERTSVPEGQDQRRERMSVPEGKDQRREWMPVPEEKEQKKGRTSVPGEQNREQQWSSMPEEQRAGQGEISVSQRQRTSASEENWSFGDSCEAFNDGEIVSCRKIQIRDLSKLHCRECALRNNRFLLYGYYNFGHLLLGKKCTGGYILGVPGGYDQQERFMANMFGFPYFKESKLIELPKGRGGYWYRLINTPNFH